MSLHPLLQNQIKQFLVEDYYQKPFLQDFLFDISESYYVLTDTSEQKYAQEKLKRSEEHYRNIVEDSAAIVYKTNAAGFFIFVNQGAEEITGYTEKELLNKHFSELIRQDKKAEALAFYKAQVDQKNKSTYYEFPIITHGGEDMWIGQSVYLSNSAAEFTVMAIDITERKKREAALEKKGTDWSGQRRIKRQHPLHRKKRHGNK